jgi:hypothetical protein
MMFTYACNFSAEDPLHGLRVVVAAPRKKVTTTPVAFHFSTEDPLQAHNCLFVFVQEKIETETVAVNF